MRVSYYRYYISGKLLNDSYNLECRTANLVSIVVQFKSEPIAVLRILVFLIETHLSDIRVINIHVSLIPVSKSHASKCLVSRLLCARFL